MAKRANYDDLAGFKTPTQRKNEAQIQTVIIDMRRIEETLVSNSEDDIKQLHIEIDGTYQNKIDNWYNSIWGYAPGYGINYELLSERSLKENLNTFKAKLRGFLFDLCPDIEQINSVMITRQELGEKNMTKSHKKLLADYAKIKEKSMGTSSITIQDSEYPLLKDTLEYLLNYEYIYKIEIDMPGYMYIKNSAFDLFTEHILAQETEEVEEKLKEMIFDNKKVFVVHGHDGRLLDEVELMLRRIGLQPIILKNEANEGRTVIEKIEDLSDVGFGVVLYTCCDEGRKKGTVELNSRARQNVVFEHGYLCAKIGRKRVAALNDDGIEVPSDLSGVLYIPHSDSNWKQLLMREMRAAGLDFDSTNA